MKYYLSLGSNSGNRKAFLIKAIDLLAKSSEIEKLSQIFESEPYGVKRQRAFLNAACIIKSNLRPFRLLRKIKEIELFLGRRRSFRWGPREIDIDILDWDGGCINSTILSVPHKEMNMRNFVLTTLQNIDPNYKNRTGESIKKLIEKCPDNSRVSLFKDQW